jgi:hypothetical protein
MSVDMYMACDECKSCIWVAQTGMSGFTFYSGEPRCMKALGHWLRAHYLCDPAPHLATEHVVDRDGGWEHVEWKGES